MVSTFSKFLKSSLGNTEVLLVYRSLEERRRLPERINLNSRRLKVFPSIREVIKEQRKQFLNIQISCRIFRRREDYDC